MSKPNFVECKDIDSANAVDLDEYVFLDRMSSSLGIYVFKVRERKR